MAKFYANVNPAVDTFSGLIAKTNSLLYDMSTGIVSVDSTTNGAIVSGNGGVNGILFAQTMVVTGGLRGGNTSSNAVLTITTNVAMNGVFLTVGNSTVNSVVNTTAFYTGNATVYTTVNATSFSGTANNSTNFGGLSLATVQTQITGNAATAYTNAIAIAANATNLTSGTVNTARLPAAINVATSVWVGNDTVYATHNATSFSGTSNNSTNFGGLTLATVQTQITGNATTAYTNAAAYADTKAATAYTNAIAIAANATNLTSGTVNTARLPAAINVATSVYVGNDSVYTTVNATSFSGTANNSTNFGGLALATVQGQITGNAASAYTNAVATAATDASTKASTAYTNALGQATTLSSAAYTNALGQATTLSSAAYTNAVATAASDATSKAGTAYSNAIAYAATISGTAYTNAAAYADTKAATAYTNAIAVSATNAGTAYTNAVAIAATDATTKAGTAYTNAVATAASDASTKAGTAYNNAVSQATTLSSAAYTNALGQATTLSSAAYTNAAAYADTKAATAYTNAINYATTNASGVAGVAYTNAIAIAANATNLTSGTVNTARLPAAINVATSLYVGNDTVYTTVNSTAYSGLAATATKLATARYISVTTDATGNVQFDGSGNAALALTLANSGATAGLYGNSISYPLITVDAKGRVTNISTFTYTTTGAGVVSSFNTRTGDITLTSGDVVSALTYTPLSANTTGTINGGLTLTNSDLNVRDVLSTREIRVGNATVNTVTNSTSFSGTSANATLFAGLSLATVQGQITGNAATAYTNAASYADTKAGTAYTNAVATAATDATTKAGTAYSNAVTVSSTDASTKAGTAYTNAIAVAASDATTKSNAAYTNAVAIAATDASTKAGTAYTNALGQATTLSNAAYTNAVAIAATDASTKAATAYSNAIANAASAAAAIYFPKTGGTLSGDVVITGNLNITGTTVYANVTNLDVKDLNITVGKGAASNAASDGAGITVDTPNAQIYYSGGSNTWNLNRTTTPASNNALDLGSTVMVWGSAYVTNVLATSVTGTLLTAAQPNITANNSTNLGGVAASGYQTTAGLSANVLTLSANLATYLGNNSGTYANIVTSIGTAYTNAVATAASDATTKSNAAYTNAIAIAANATNLTSGTVSVARIPTSYVNTTANFALSGNIAFTGANTTINGAEIGYLDIPQRIISAGANTLIANDAGSHIYNTNTTSTFAVTVPNNTSVALNNGTAITLINGGNVFTIAAGTGVTLRLAGTATTGTRTLANNAVATLIKVATETWYISGAGVT